LQKFVLRHHKRLKNRKLKELYEFTDKGKEFRVRNEYVEKGIEADIKYFKF
jgi:hypothetical protein